MGPKNRHIVVAAVLRMAAQRGREGFSMADLSEFPQSTLFTTLSAMLREGKMHRGKLGHRTVRFFSEKAWAEAYGAARRKPRYVNGVKATASGRAGWPEGTPAIYPKDGRGRPLYKVIVCQRPQDPSAPIRTGWGPAAGLSGSHGQGGSHDAW